jgi:phenylpyruvate tautomerase PptA (4-oxalocrotonate tautomerase family)
MPMLDAYIPEGALPAEAERRLISRLTDLLLEHEGADPRDLAARSLAWVFVHRPAAVFVAGEPASAPRYRFVASVPEGQYDDERRVAIVEDVTTAVLDAEGDAHPRDVQRVWVFANEIPDGNWGGGGRVMRLGDIVGHVIGDAEAGHRYAGERLAARREQVVA